jgi:hypothetical protein
MHHWKQLHRSIQRLRMAALERELIAACRRPVLSLALRSTGLRSSGIPSTSRSTLDAAEGFFLASAASTFFWSALLFLLSRHL